jgi:ADP-ribose pyrophosphatase
MILDEKTISTEKIYSGNIISLEKLIVELPDKNHAERDIIRHPGASAVLPMDNEGYVYLVRQYRKPLEKITLEIPAGRLNKGEMPMDCAVRELSEETGLSAGKMTHIFTIDTTPAFCDEMIHIYLASDLIKGNTHTDKDEFLRQEKIHIDILFEMVINGKITDSKTLTAILYAKLIRNNLVKI